MRLCERRDLRVIIVCHQRARYGYPPAASLRLEACCSADERLQERRSVDTAAARRDHERPFIRRRLCARRRMAPAEIAAVANAACKLVVEAVGGDEVDRAWIAVDADRGVAPAQHVVGACLGPELSHESGVVDHVSES